MVILRINSENMVSSSELVRNFNEMLDKSKESPVFIMCNNDIESIMIDIEEYEMLLEKIEYLENQLEDSYIEEIVEERKENFEIKDALEVE